MTSSSRRTFLTDVGRGMLAAGLGTTLANDLGFSIGFASDATEGIPLGKYARLVDLMQNSPAEALQPKLAQMIQRGETDLQTLIAAGALANAVTFGGCDYVGFHTAMAMIPSLQMSRLLPTARQPLPVLKVLYRNSQQIQKDGSTSKAALEAFHATEHAAEHAASTDLGIQIRDACRHVDAATGEKLLSTTKSPIEAFNALQPAVQDDLNVHRFVFAYRTFGLVELLGADYSHALLKQCVRLCADHERMHIEHKQPESPIRTLIPKLLDQYKLVGKPLGKRDPGDAAVEALCQVIYEGPRERAAEAAAAALAEGIDPEIVGEAISMASNQYVLRQGSDKWRTHGDSAGVHASDATNAWRNMARRADPQYAISGLIVAAYHAGIQSAPFTTPPYPTDEHRALLKVQDPARLLAETEDAIRQNDQGRATAAIQIYGERNLPVDPVFDLMLKYAISEDGRLHGEKYFHTVREEFGTTRPSFRWRQIVGLARVTASAYGYNRDDQHGFRAAGYEAACKLLGVEC
ncbi:hypothetical protein [Schlesneria paludicola]|uniref:hypothetical protein n=1 Tax=Schlesneria paludicola TaxID=360056 RepID=UPI000299D830|nr:hypothetical protein [Schlesneria paludicola]